MSRGYTGWFKIHRSIGNPDSNVNIFANRPIEKHIFITLIEIANYKKGKTPLKGQKIILDRGQVCTSRSELVKYTARSHQVVRSALKWLNLTNQITINSNNSGTIITILDYNKFQDYPQDENQPNNQPNNQRITNEQPTNNHIVRIKEFKNLRNKKNTPDFHPADSSFENIDSKQFNSDNEPNYTTPHKEPVELEFIDDNNVLETDLPAQNSVKQKPPKNTYKECNNGVENIENFANKISKSNIHYAENISKGNIPFADKINKDIHYAEDINKSNIHYAHKTNKQNHFADKTDKNNIPFAKDIDKQNHFADNINTKSTKCLKLPQKKSANNKSSAGDMTLAKEWLDFSKQEMPYKKFKLEKFIDEIRITRESIKYSDEKMNYLYKWCRGHYFWNKVTKSPGGLRKKSGSDDDMRKIDHIVMQFEEDYNEYKNECKEFQQYKEKGIVLRGIPSL